MTLILKFDGGSRGNPGVAGCGFIITDGDKTLSEGYKYLGDNITNNHAEYSGLFHGLEALTKISNNESILIQGDSLLVINQMSGKYKVNSANLMELYLKCITLIKDIKGIKGIKPIEFNHIKRDQNTDADRLANIAMTNKSSNC